MEGAEYRDALRSVLDTASSVVESRLASMRAAATAHTEGIAIDVSVDQDGEGGRHPDRVARTDVASPCRID
ncbi:DUF6389 family protein [Rhodococcus erythropolis]|uniref:DUF6389 family protein n=1 Tax=Rhodococcus erythropolis TaxID=1833 RepID=UPI00294A367A|nr:DUF6389 family protein [Rhodococcus erythropolis]MDV6276595.1 DUF6389 family protein [Rhodococcus erythropolis]